MPDPMQAVMKRQEIPTRWLTRRNGDRRRPFDDPANVQALIDFPQRLVKEAASGKQNPRCAALLAHAAAADGIMLMAPIRLRHLLALELDRNLIAAGASLHLVFEAHEVKNREVMDIPLPQELSALIRHDCDCHRPHLAALEKRGRIDLGASNHCRHSRLTYSASVNGYKAERPELPCLRIADRMGLLETLGR